MNVTARTPVMGAGQRGCPHSLQGTGGRRNRESRPGLSMRWGIACLLVALFGLTGCGTTDNPTATPVSPGEISAPPGTGTPAGGAASIRLTFAGGAGELPAPAARGAVPQPSVRADTTAAAFVVVRLLSLFPGQPATAALASRTVTVPVDAAGNASIEVSGLPVRPLVVRVRLEGATVAGLTDFQGAADLASGANAVTVQPTGSGLTHDLAAQVLLALAAMPDQVQFTPVALVTAARTALASAAANLAASGTAVTATGSPLLPTLAVQHLREAAATL